MATSNFYKGLKSSHNIKDDTYYIHLHSYNIGRAANRGNGQMTVISGAYQNRKKKFFNLAKQDYKQRMGNRISTKAKQGISELFNSDNDYTYFDEELRKSLQKNLNVDNLNSLMQSSKKTNFSNMLRGNLQVHIQEYNDIIEFFIQMAQLIKSPNGVNFALALEQSKLKGEGYVGVATAGSNLKTALQKLKTEVNGQLIYPQDIAAAATQIEYLSNSLLRKTTAAGNKLTQNSIRNICNNIISAGFAESFAMDIKSDAILNVDKAIKGALGTKGTYVPTLNGKEKWVSQGKEDVRLKNIEISIEKFNQKYNLEIGLSSKFYRNNLMFGHKSGKNKNINSISSGSGETLGNLIKNTFLTNYDRYIVYNAFANLGDYPAIESIQEAILMRNINKFFAGSSKADFNSYIISNGEVISLWQLIQEAFVNNIGSTSLFNQPIALEFLDSSKNNIMNANQPLYEKGEKIVSLAWKRSKTINSLINEARVQARINTLALLKNKV